MADLERELVESGLWLAEELAAALNISLPEAWGDMPVDGLSIDSRTTNNADLFIALSGKPRPEFNDFVDTGRDGHDFLENAISAGAVGCLVDRQIELPGRFLTCSDTLDGLWDLGRFRRAQLDVPVIAVTGSSGKTTLKSFLEQALDCDTSEGSLNNHIGVPLSLARTPKSAEYGVFEIGTNHPGEICRLARLVQPDIAVVLNVKNAHIGNFASEGALRHEKLSIGDGVRDGGSLIVHEDLFEEARNRFPQLVVRRFGTSKSAWLRHKDLGANNVELICGENSLTTRVPGGGEHRANTLAATAAVLSVLDLPLKRVFQIENEMPAGRGRQIQVGGICIVDESYNANPDSMQQCLIHLRNSAAKRRLAIVGDMAELGDATGKLHRSLVPVLNQLDGVICVGETMQTNVVPYLDERVQLGSFTDPDGLVEFCTELLRSGGEVLVKSSKRLLWDYKFIDKLTDALQSNPKNP